MNLSFEVEIVFLRVAAGGKHETMEYLYSTDENLCNEKDENRDTGLTFASRPGSRETVGALIKESNADVYALDIEGQNCVLGATELGKFKKN